MTLQPPPTQRAWRCALGHTFSVNPGDENCPERDMHDGSWCGAPVEEVVMFDGEVCDHPVSNGFGQCAGCGWDFDA